jgi:hypothetical protein
VNPLISSAATDLVDAAGIIGYSEIDRIGW